MRHCGLVKLLLLLSVLTTALLAQDAITPTKKIVLFNGKNLDGWYSWLRETRYEDPKKVFTVENGQIRVSGEDWGGIATKQAYRDYHLIVEWRWGGKTLPPRVKNARDSGILIHAVGEDGKYNNTWLESIESQIIEGGAGDIILVGGANKPTLTVNSIQEGKETYWKQDGKPVTKDSGRFNWYGRSRFWKDVVDFRGVEDVEAPMGKWNRQEIFAQGDKITYVVNGKVVIHGYDSSHRTGKIQLQSEGAEIYFRRVEMRPIKKMPKID